MLGVVPSFLIDSDKPSSLAGRLEPGHSTSSGRCKNACPLPSVGRPCEQTRAAGFMLIADNITQINRSIVPGFYRVLQEQSPEKQLENAKELRGAFDKLLAAAHPQGPFFMGSQMSFVDVQAAPWVIRLRRVLKPYRGWPDTEEGTRWASWVNAIDSNEHVRATTSSDELYLDSYARYAGKSRGRFVIWIEALDIDPNRRKPAQHVPSCECNQFGTGASLGSHQSLRLTFGVGA